MPDYQDYIPAASDANEDAYAGITIYDPGSSEFDAADPERCDAKFFGKPVMDEILALIKGRVASKGYRQSFTCIAGLNVGDPVYISAANTATLALATTVATSRVFGFVRYKPTTTTCYIDHFIYKSGLSGLTAGGKVYLTNAGGFSATAGTIAKEVGFAISTTEALLFASAITASTDVGLTRPIIAKTANYTATDADYTILCDASGGSFTITLPAAASHSGRMYQIKKTDSSANTVTIDGNASETIDGATTKVIGTQYESYTIQSNGSNWFIV